MKHVSSPLTPAAEIICDSVEAGVTCWMIFQASKKKKKNWGSESMKCTYRVIFLS